MLAGEGAYKLRLAPAQREVWVGQQLDPSNPGYNCAGYVEILGEVDITRLALAIRTAVAESESLRACFPSGTGEPWQEVEAMAPWSPTIIDFAGAEDGQARAEAWMLADLAAPITLDRPPLFTVVVFTLRPNRVLLYLRYHHIVLDGAGHSLLWRRIAEIYSALVEDRPPPDRESGSLSDLLDEDVEYRRSPGAERDREYWLRAMAGRPGSASADVTPPLPAAEPSRAETSFPDTTAAALRAAATRTSRPWSVLVLAAVAGYAHRLRGEPEIILGVPVPARMTPLARTTPAMLANELPLRIPVAVDPTAAGIVTAVSAALAGALRHQRYRSEDPRRATAAGGPVVNVVSFDQRLTFGRVPSIAHYLSSGPVRGLSIDVYGQPDGSGLRLAIATNPDVESEPAAKHLARLPRFLDAFLEDINTDSARPVTDIDTLAPGERRLLVDDRNATERPYDLSPCLHQLVERQARRTPDAIAVSAASRSMTYRDLVTSARGLAARLRSLGVTRGARVGVYATRSVDLVLELLAVLEAGAAYVPLDPEQPIARTVFQIRDAGIGVVLTSPDLANHLAPCGVLTLTVDDGERPTAAEALPRVDPSDAAYVIFTSGSTGQPKGVVVPHRGVVNRLLWAQQEFGLRPDDRVLQKTSFTFDVSVWEFFWPLITGARLSLAEPGAQRDPRALAEIIRRDGITTIHFVPSMLDEFLAEPTARAHTGLRRVLCSGETLSARTVRDFLDVYPPGGGGPTLTNLYGPTEASIDVTWWPCGPAEADGRVPIGRPVANTRVYLVDPVGELVPDGAAGELCVAGPQVANGYLGRPALTAERFVPNPFHGGTMYRTGDVARYRPDGAIEFLGRLDHQVKVRGFRVEPGEIEATLLAHPRVERAVVMAWDSGAAGVRLVGYLVAPEVRTGELTDWLAARLPAHMVPAHIVPLDRLPTLPSGKLDRAALPAPGPDQVAAAPSSDMERVLRDAWCAVLGIETSSVVESFFAQGGDSILAIRLRAELERRGWTFTVADLYDAPTIRLLAGRLRSAATERSSARTAPFAMVRAEDRERMPTDVVDAFPLTTLQAGMLFHTEYHERSSIYRVVTSVRVGAGLDEDVLRQAIADTVRRHPALRCSHDLAGYSEPLQLVHEDVEVPLTVAADLGDLPESARREALTEFVDQAKFHRFDPVTPPLLAFTAHPIGELTFQLTVVEHHVVLDGWSDAMMLDEIVTRYRAALAGEESRLPEVASLFRDFVAEERRALADPAHREYWSRTLSGVEIAPLPGRGGVREAERRAPDHRPFEVGIPVEVADRLGQIAREQGLPLKSLLIAAHVAVLGAVTGTTEVVTGLITHGRLAEPDGDAVVGVFLNTIPLRVGTERTTGLDVARSVVDQERAATPHRRYPYARLHGDLVGVPRLDSYVNIMDFHRSWYSRDRPAAVLDAFGVAETDFPLAVNYLVDRGGLRLWLDCDLSALDAEFCERLAGYYATALRKLAERPDLRVSALDPISAAERATLTGWHGPSVDYDRTATVHGLVERHASSSGTAAIHRGDRLSHAELHGRANRLARRLARRGVRPGDRVGVAVPRGLDLVVSLLAVLKSGAAFVPLDPGFPRQRLEFIATDANLRHVITGSGGQGAFPADWLVPVDDLGGLSDAPVDARVGGDAIAYVIYTSGSTGTPKGTLVRHRNVANFCAAMDAVIGAAPDDVVLALTSVSFDISVLELLWPLTRGATVVVADDRMIDNLARDRRLPDDPIRQSGLTDAPGGAVDLATRRHAITVGHQADLADACWVPAGCPVADVERAARRGQPVVVTLDWPAEVDDLAAQVTRYRKSWAGTGAGRFAVLVAPAVADIHADALADPDELIRALASIGVDEIVWDLGGIASDDLDTVLDGLTALRDRHAREVADGDHSFAELCRRHRVSMVQATPSFFAAVSTEPAALTALRDVGTVLVGGEAFPPGLARRLVEAAPDARLFNMYGPTETTIWSTVHRVDPKRDTARIPIGRPVANTTALVVDTSGALVPIGAPGELCLGGDGVTAGYLGRDDLTEERFRAHPPFGALYRTGDRVRWRADGVLEFLGRVDRQVKIRGHRVEPDEVENVLSAHPQVTAAAVVAVERPSGQTELVAFVDGGRARDTSARDEHVRRWGQVWDSVYEPDEVDGENGEDRDFAGWLSSYTGRPIPADEMREWFGHTARRVEFLGPRGIVDVGVGVGLFLRHFCGRVERYRGFDVSAAALRAAARLSDTWPDRVELTHGDAARLDDLPESDGDVVLLNSVVQYFPGPDYLRRVLGGAARVAGSTGAVFVGDVRDVALLRAFHATVALRRAHPLLPVADLVATIDRQVAEERELCLAGEFFTDVAARLGLGARLEPKRGHAVNELTVFRYDVTLLGAGRPGEPPGTDEVPWSRVGGPDGLAGLLERPGDRRALLVTGVPNPRLVRPLALLRLLDDADPGDTVWELERRLWAFDGGPLDAESIVALGERLGWETRLYVSGSDGLAAFDALFTEEGA